MSKTLRSLILATVAIASLVVGFEIHKSQAAADLDAPLQSSAPAHSANILGY